MQNTNKNNIIRERLYGIDLLKIMAAFLVVFYHFGCLDFHTENIIQYWPNENYIIYTLSAMSIPIFFMVNGALLLNKEYSYKQLLIKILKLLSLIVIWSIVDFPSWFFKTLIILYIIYPLLKYIFDYHKKALYLLIGTIIIFPYFYNLLVVIAKLLSLHNIPVYILTNRAINSLPRTGLFTMYSVPLFLLGGIQLRERLKQKTHINLLLLIIGWIECLFESTIITRYSGILHDSGNGNFPTVGALLMAVGVFNLIYDLDLKSLKSSFKKFFQFLSKNILMVYVLHLMLIKIIKTTVLANTAPLSLSVVLIFTIIIFFICALIGELFSKIPIIRNFIRI